MNHPNAVARRMALAAAMILGFGIATVTAQTDGNIPAATAQTDDSLFSDESNSVTVPADTGQDLVTTNFEKRTGVELGGDLTLAWSVDPETGKISQGTDYQTSSLGLYLDARPAEDFRTYFRGRYSMTGVNLSGTISVEELFADLSMGGFGRLRAGKQAANWGLGYWWSPADILSLHPIDEYNPEAKREGTIALKYALPLGLDTLSLYTTAGNATSVDELGFAARGEFVLGGAEFGIGGFWRPDGKVKPRIVGTGSFKLASVDMYTEAVVSFGSERRYADFSSGTAVVVKPENLLFQAALGFIWSNSDAEGRWEASAVGEYYYNGAGLPEGGSYAGRRDALTALIAAGDLSLSDLTGYGTHYAGLVVKLEDLWSSGLGVDAEWRSNIAEASGYYRAVAAFQPVTNFRVEMGWKAFYGPVGGEYSPKGEAGYLVGSIRLWEYTTISGAYPVYGGAAKPSISLLFSGQF